MRTLIVDDEPLARERIRKLLQRETDVEILGECGDGREAVAAIRRDRPDLVFLDVQMPELDGFGVLEHLARETLPAVVFVTAYDQFALRAFEVHALDYLLKPFDRERFEKTLERVRDQFQARQTAQLSHRISELLADLKTGAKQPDRLAIKSGGKVVFVRIEEVDWIEAADNYVNLHVGNNSHLHRQTMAALEGKLPADKFLRISRSTIVNIEQIKELQPLFHGEYAVILRNGTRLTLSRSHREKLNRLLGKAT